MSALSLHRSHAGSVLAKANGLAQAVVKGAAALLREIELRRAMRDLHELTDTQLRDIGVSPGDVEHLVRHGRDRLGRPCRAPGNPLR